MKFEIWDAHTHMTGVPGDTPEARVGNILRYADRMGIERLIVFLGMALRDHDPSPDVVRVHNDEVMRAVTRYPDRTFGFAYVNPRHTQASLDELDRCIRDGPLVGVKLWVAMRCNDPALDPLVERATELKAVVLQHNWMKTTGNLPGESTAMDVAELASRHPKTQFISAHCGGKWEPGLRAIRPHPNVYADIDGSDPTSGFTEMGVRELGADRVVYGSDIGGRSFASQLAKVLGADLPDSAKQLILSGNIKRLLQPILQEKGIKI
jgi:predicted TIM-barrel fold metal-dependent hydrolase